MKVYKQTWSDPCPWQRWITRSASSIVVMWPRPTSRSKACCPPCGGLGESRDLAFGLDVCERRQVGGFLKTSNTQWASVEDLHTGVVLVQDVQLVSVQGQRGGSNKQGICTLLNRAKGSQESGTVRGVDVHAVVALAGHQDVPVCRELDGTGGHDDARTHAAHELACEREKRQPVVVVLCNKDVGTVWS